MDALDLIAKLKMDISEYEEGLSKASSKAESSGSSITGSFGRVASGVGTALSAVTKVTTAAVTAAATGVATLTTKAIEYYGEYEQLVGGIETLFGAGGQSLEEYADSVGKTVDDASAEYDSLISAQNSMLDNASNAYKTAGLSANDYMDTAISMSAAMINSLDGDTSAAADMVDLAITDMSDNVNKMGTSMEFIQNAYVGFSRGNYAMLDNLALGFSGTKEGMQELLDKAEELSGIEYDISSYSDIVSAIHVVQTEMGITGTTAEEASTTIQGSANQMKAAWTNLVTGIADENADLDTLMQNLVDSIVGYTDSAGNEVNGFLDNIIPVIETALTSIGTLIEKLIPQALELIPTLITDVLPQITTAATSLAQGLVDSLSSNMDTITTVISQVVSSIVDLLPDIISLGGQIVSTLGTALMNNLDTILEAGSQILETILTGLSENAESLSAAVVQIVTMLAGFIGENIDLILNSALLIVEGLANGLIENLDTLMNAGLELLMAIIDALPEFLVELANALPDIITAIIDFLTGDGLTDILEGATTMFMAMVEALPDILNALVDGLGQIIDSLLAFMSGDGSSEILESALYMFLNIAAALPEILGTLLGALGELLLHVVTSLNSYASNMLSAGKELFGKIKDAVVEVGSEVVSKIKDKVKEWVDAIKSKVSEFKDAGKNLIVGLWNGISDKAQWVYNKITGMGETIVNKVKSLFGIASPSKVFKQIGIYMAEGLGIGWDEEIEDVNNKIDKDLKYEGEMDVTANYSGLNAKNTVTAGVNKSDTDTDQPIIVNVYTTVDGKVIGQTSYQYMKEQMSSDERGLTLAQGGYY